MIQVLVLALGVGLGFVGSRALRRPQNAAAAASVARNVSGSLGRRRGLTAPELQRACFSEMVRHVQVDRDGRTHAPGRYVLHLHPDDIDLIDESPRWFTDGLVAALGDAAREHGWSVDGAVSIAYEADPSRRPGVPTALAVPPTDPRAAPAAAPAPKRDRTGTVDGRTLAVERSDTGERIVLDGSILTLGRSRDRDITVDDNRVSRAHLRFERQQRGWVVVDEGSANGTLVRNERVEPGRPTPIRPGDVVSVGPVDLRVVAGATGNGEAGTRALDDSDRNRISREFLPPHGTAR
ncbi:MAG: DUF3662 domain-containing protein [Actinobacteria bacterium]|nr:DUF3662 domain-containing protein [Actinomycetota bacterium]